MYDQAPVQPRETALEIKARSFSRHPMLHPPCRQHSQDPLAHAAGLVSNTPAPPKAASNHLAGSAPTSRKHPQLHLDHTRKSSCSFRTSGDRSSTTTSCCKTISPRLVRLVYQGNVWRVLTWGPPGFIVLGPDCFFGVPIQDLPEDRDKASWANEALVKAREVFPKWLDAVKATYGEKPHHPSSI